MARRDPRHRFRAHADLSSSENFSSVRKQLGASLPAALHDACRLAMVSEGARRLRRFDTRMAKIVGRSRIVKPPGGTAFWDGLAGQKKFEYKSQPKNIMTNWISIVEDGDSIVTAHFPVTQVCLVIEALDNIKIHLRKGSVNIKGVGVEKLVPKLLTGDMPVLKSGVAGIKSVIFDRELAA